MTIAQINGLHPFAVYAAVQVHKGEPIRVPSDWDIWQNECKHATARLTAFLTECAVLEDKCRDQKLNDQHTAPLSWDRFYEELARRYGVSKGIVGPEDDESKYQPLVGKGGKYNPIGYGPPTVHKTTFSFVEWAKQPENQKEIIAKSDGQVSSNPFEDPEENFQMGDAVLTRIGALNMNKARRLGWKRYIDTIENIFEMHKQNAKLWLVPEMVVSEPRPLV